jgi:hypothetical protein
MAQWPDFAGIISLSVASLLSRTGVLTEVCLIFPLQTLAKLLPRARRLIHRQAEVSRCHHIYHSLIEILS